MKHVSFLEILYLYIYIYYIYVGENHTRTADNLHIMNTISKFIAFVVEPSFVRLVKYHKRMYAYMYVYTCI